MPAESRDGIVQLGVDGACTWLVLDAASRSCAIIDPVEPLTGRIADFIRCQEYKVRAVIDTHGHPAGSSGRAALMELLADQLDRAESRHALGWPWESDCITLGNGMLVNAVALGDKLLARLPQEDGMFDSLSYLFGPRRDDKVLPQGDVRFAFTGQGMSARLASVVSPESILCVAVDTGTVSCTTLAAEKRGASGQGPKRQLDESALEGFMEEHPDALLVDVREAYEHVAAGSGSWQGRKAHSVPLSRIADRLAVWLRGEKRPLVFFCRTGNRSAKAAACLHRLGYPDAWHVAGGLSLKSSKEGRVPVEA